MNKKNQEIQKFRSNNRGTKGHINKLKKEAIGEEEVIKKK
jgi:hypothetical protein